MELTQLPGVGPVEAKKHAKKGIIHVEQLLDIPPPQIADILKITNDAAATLSTKAAAKIRNKKGMFRTATQVEEDKAEIITTGTKALDKVLDGGLKTGATTEIYGEFGAGKTQFCYTMAVRVQLPPEKGGLNGKCVVIDTEGTFKAKRLRAIAKKLELDEEEVLNNVIIARAFNSVDQKNILLEIQNMILEEKDEERQIKLIIVDSAIGLFRQDYSGRAMLSERQKYLDEFLTINSNMANNHKLAVIWTNQVMVDPGTLFGDPIKPVGGTVLAHKSTFRVYFQKTGKLKTAKMVDSPEDSQVEVNFGLSEGGIVDPDEAEKEYDENRVKVKEEKAQAKKYSKAKPKEEDLLEEQEVD